MCLCLGLEEGVAGITINVVLRKGYARVFAAICLTLAGLFAHITSARAEPAVIRASVGASTRPEVMPPGFLGASMEFDTVRPYTGRNPRAVNPVLVQLLANIAPGQAPVLRIGGDSTDWTWSPMPGVRRPRGIGYAVTKSWLATTRALASALSAHLIVGVNLAAGRRALAAAEGRALLAGIGRQYIDALEIGNEADVYGIWPVYKPNYSPDGFMRDFARWRTALPDVPLAGPALADLGWLPSLGQFLGGEPRLRTVTVHSYPLTACDKDRHSPGYPTIANLLSDRASSGLAEGIARYVDAAHALHRSFRVDELNSVSCFGKRGVSDTFASALWMLDTLFGMASVGVDGVNVQMRRGTAHEPFTFTRSAGGWRAFVHPDYYGMLMFEQAFPPGAARLRVSSPSGPVRVWATRDRDGTVRVVAINKDTADHQVVLQVPAAGTGREAGVEWLRAPDISSRRGVTLAGETFGDKTSTGVLPGPPQINAAISAGGSYVLHLPRASAAMLTQ